ncbi:MAG: hypothetical protein ACOH2D_10970 [Gelidibacter sp.]|uniref:hypothetical protein n=1 Tax=Gelidibacter sp. TaxID=2018083 RepID=UPI0032653B65
MRKKKSRPMCVSTSAMGIMVGTNILTKKYIKKGYAIERTNAWMDSYRSLLNRFDTTNASWFQLNIIYGNIPKENDKQKV